MGRCPGQDTRNIRPEDIIEMECSSCGEIVELWPPGYSAKCYNCGRMIFGKNVPTCADWCPMGEEQVRRCLGEERYREWKESRKNKKVVPTDNETRKEIVSSEKDFGKENMPKNCEYEHNCIEELRAEHEKILAELDVLEKAANAPEIDKGKIQAFLEFSETFAEPHHQKEEEVLFPELEKRGIPKEGGPIGVMLAEHEMRKGLVNVLRDSLQAEDEEKTKESAKALIVLLRQHIDKENNILYPMAESVLTKEDLAEIGCRCREITSPIRV